MKAKFQDYDLKTLQEKVDGFVYRLLEIIKEDDRDDEKVYVEDLCQVVEDFAGRDYVVATKLKNDFVMSEWDKEYLVETLNKKVS